MALRHVATVFKDEVHNTENVSCSYAFTVAFASVDTVYGLKGHCNLKTPV